MNAIAKGKLGRLLLKKNISVVSSQASEYVVSNKRLNNIGGYIPARQIEEEEEVVSSQHNPATGNGKEQSNVSDVHNELDPNNQASFGKSLPMDEQDPASDSEASSVGDHLVDPHTINLDESFFSPTFENQFPIARDNVNDPWQEDAEQSDSESEEPTGEDDRMYQIFSQISEYDRMVKEANECSESFERRRKQMDLSQQLPTDDYDEPFLLTQAECFPENPSAGNDPDWECVAAEQHAQAEEMKNVEIFVSTSSSQKPKRLLDPAEKLKRQEWENTKKLYLATHKTHLLLLLAYGIRINRTVNHNMVEFASELYDLIANSELTATNATSLEFINSVVAYYKTVMKQSMAGGGPRMSKQRNAFVRQLVAREVTSRRMLNVILLTLLRFLSVRARLVMSLDVVPKYPPSAKSTLKTQCQNPPKGNLNSANGTQRYGDVPLTTTEILKRKPEIQQMFQISQLDGTDDELLLKRKDSPEPQLWSLKPSSNGGINDPKMGVIMELDPTTKSNAVKMATSNYFSKKVALSQAIIENKNTTNRKPNFANLRKNGIESSSKTDGEVEEKRLKLVSCKYFRKKPKVGQTFGSREHKSTTKDKPNLAKLLKNKPESASGVNTKRTDPKYSVPELDTWIECYLEQEQRWTVVEAGLGQTDCLDPVIDRILAPAAYVFAWEADGTIVDVSSRYRWRNEQLALRNRVDGKWLLKALAPYRFRGVDEARLREQLEFRRLKLRAPMPTTIAQCKNHPSYCLHRHLQKFQGIYPPDAPPLGYIQGEPLYARECVHTLHSREVWLRHAKVIRLFEQPYKIVRTKLKRQPADLELFGYWQTEDYIPPEPVNGIVPRNAYGNIEIFKECMLPKGTIHLKQYGLSYVCRKLGIDYAVAVVGFGVHAGGNHPVFDGIVICEEHCDRLLEAWKRHQDEVAQKKLEKKQNAVLNNWVKLVKGLLVRKKLKHKYNFEGW